MVHSMTGYGRAVQTLRGREITAELRSVNNRFLDCGVKLPRSFSYAEDAVKQVADYVTAADNNHDGVAEAIEKFILQ